MNEHPALIAFAREFLEWAENHDGIFVWERAGYDPDGTRLHDDEGWRGLVADAQAAMALALGHPSSEPPKVDEVAL